MQGSGKPLEDMRYPPLYQHSKRLGRLTESDGSDLLGGLGIALVGGGLGAVLSGESFESKGVLLCIVVGLVLVLAGILVHRANTESARCLKEDFDRDLSLWEQGDSDIKAIRMHFEAQERESSRT